MTVLFWYSRYAWSNPHRSAGIIFNTRDALDKIYIVQWVSSTTMRVLFLIPADKSVSSHIPILYRRPTVARVLFLIPALQRVQYIATHALPIITWVLFLIPVTHWRRFILFSGYPRQHACIIFNTRRQISEQPYPYLVSSPHHSAGIKNNTRAV